MSFRSKKAISPIIAAVLLVVIVVSLGAAVMSLVRNYLTEGETQVNVEKEAIKCGRDTSIEWVTINEDYQICNSTHEDDPDLASLNFMVENTGTTNVLDLQVRMVGSKGIFQNNTAMNESFTLRPGGVVVVNVSYDPETVGEFRQVRVVPRINLPGISEHAYCSDSGITVSAVPNNCTSYQ
ncbi:hypothetical protein KY359_04760 [Candidatus Woesearchaeota archaeon]|nr:hypothetical protein [Candidatus Woesearchaeota archaeon]